MLADGGANLKTEHKHLQCRQTGCIGSSSIACDLLSLGVSPSAKMMCCVQHISQKEAEMYTLICPSSINCYGDEFVWVVTC